MADVLAHMGLGPHWGMNGEQSERGVPVARRELRARGMDAELDDAPWTG
ncbi:hypothetical protein [Salinimonas iocasae]|nr:hypothetical protein [Salinimonas iocasae]